MRNIFSFSREFTLQNSNPVHISVIGRKHKKAISSVVANDVLNVTESLNQDEIRVARQSGLITSTTAGLRIIESRALTRMWEHVIVTRHVANIIPLAPFFVIVATFSTRPVHLPKKMVIDRVADSPTLGKQPNRSSRPSSGEGDINAVHKPSKSRELQMGSHEAPKRMTRNDSKKTITKTVYA